MSCLLLPCFGLLLLLVLRSGAGKSMHPLIDAEENATHLFVDDHFTEHSSGVEFVVHQPRRTNERSIIPEMPWEPHIAAYNSVVQAGPEDYRIYYDAIGPTWRLLCVAVSRDGVVWSKPSLGLNEFNGSTSNNIILGGDGKNRSVSPGNVFVDTNPATASAHRFKLNVYLHPGHEMGGVYVFGSADGFRFERLSGPHIRFSDTQAVMFYEKRRAKYAIYFRTHMGRPDRAVCHDGEPPARSVARLEVENLAVKSWGFGDHTQEAGNTTVFNIDAYDNASQDVYTSGATQIADATFLFPMMYFHCSMLATSERFKCATSVPQRPPPTLCSDDPFLWSLTCCLLPL